MKSWLLYFFAVLLALCLLPAGKALPMTADRPETVRIGSDGEVLELEAEEYISRVIASEYGEVTDLETAKALAVTLRSAVRYVRLNGCKHSDFDFCDSPDCCFALADPNDCAPEALGFARSAVEATAGEVLTCNGEPAMALYTLCGGVGTRSCDIYPQIVGVPRSISCRTHVTTVAVSESELYSLVGGAEGDFCLVSDEDGYCEFAVFNGRLCSAYELADALGLPSLCFTAEKDVEGNIVFTCLGVGSGYGLDLCRANELSATGANYRMLLGIAFPKMEITSPAR